MINISNILDLTNYAFVLFFGITAAFYFVGMRFEDNKNSIFLPSSDLGAYSLLHICF